MLETEIGDKGKVHHHVEPSKGLAEGRRSDSRERVHNTMTRSLRVVAAIYPEFTGFRVIYDMARYGAWLRGAFWRMTEQRVMTHD